MRKKIHRARTCFTLLSFAACIHTMSAQSVITGTLPGYDGKPLEKALVLMAADSPRETPLLIHPYEKGRFRHESQEKGLHFLSFLGARHGRRPIVRGCEVQKASAGKKS